MNNKTFRANKSREEIIALLTQTFYSDIYDLALYWSNVADFLTKNDLTVKQLEWALLVQTTSEVCPALYTTVPPWLPRPIKTRVVRHRIKQIDRYVRHPSAEEKRKFQDLQSLFSTIVYILSEDEDFVRAFVEYTGTPIQFSDGKRHEERRIFSFLPQEKQYRGKGK